MSMQHYMIAKYLNIIGRLLNNAILADDQPSYRFLIN